MRKTTARAPSPRLLTGILVTGSLTVLPLAFIATPAEAAGAAPITTAALPLRQDCYHTGRVQWQQDRGRWMWGDCDNTSGHWQQRPDNLGHGGQAWQWHRDRAQQPPPKLNSY
jgi:hypothetical protein